MKRFAITAAALVLRPSHLRRSAHSPSPRCHGKTKCRTQTEKAWSPGSRSSHWKPGSILDRQTHRALRRRNVQADPKLAIPGTRGHLRREETRSTARHEPYLIVPCVHRA